MRPIEFRCEAVIPRSGERICADIADLSKWPLFTGYGPLPGIAAAEYELRTDHMVGSRIRVRNTDGSRHVEEIRDWTPGASVGMTLRDFTPPLSGLATHFTEEWRFAAAGGATRATRSFRMFPRSAAARPAVWLISLLFRRAIAHHLRLMAGAA